MTTPAKWKPAEPDDVVARAQALYTAALDSKPGKGEWPSDALVDAVTVIPELIRKLHEVTAVPRLAIPDDAPRVPPNMGRFVVIPDEEADKLRAWKAEALEVLAGWEAVWEALGSPGRLGEQKSAGALAEVERLREAWRMAEPVLTERDTLARKVERLRALADRIESHYDKTDLTSWHAASLIRAALDEEETR